MPQGITFSPDGSLSWPNCLWTKTRLPTLAVHCDLWLDSMVYRDMPASKLQWHCLWEVLLRPLFSLTPFLLYKGLWGLPSKIIFQPLCLHPDFHSSRTILHSLQQWSRVPFPPTSSMWAILTGVMWNFSVVCIWISLIVGDPENSFIRLLTIFDLFLSKVSGHLICPCVDWFVSLYGFSEFLVYSRY